MIEPLIITSSLLFNKEVATQTISSTTKNIYSEIDKIMTNDNKEFHLILEKMDINTKLDVINTFIKEIEYSGKHFNETVNKALKYIEYIKNYKNQKFRILIQKLLIIVKNGLVNFVHQTALLC